jgi:DNA polymerase III delta prime subunit
MNELAKRQYDDFVWELKYRPDTLDQIVLPERLVKSMNKIKSMGKVPNMLFYGPSGGGKTTTAFALAGDMDLSAYYINMSLDTSINDIRSNLMDFARGKDIHGRQKVIIGDEFDGLSTAAMESMKGIIEKVSKNCKFIFTSNNRSKVIPFLISRLHEVEFIFTKDEAPALKKQIFKVACEVCKKEKVKADKAAIAEVVKFHFPDMRKILQFLQMLSLRGDITMDQVQASFATDVETFFELAKTKDWTGIRQYIVDLPIHENDFYSIIYRDLEKYIKTDSLPEAIVMLAKYQYESSFVVDPQISLAALAIEMMSQLNFKDSF